MYSETLGRMLRFRMTTHAIRCIKKAGGIDQYLLKTKESEIKFPKALKLKEEIVAVRATQRAAAKKSLNQDGSGQLPQEKHEAKEDASKETGGGKAAPAALHGTEPVRSRHLGLHEVLWF